MIGIFWSGTYRRWSAKRIVHVRTTCSRILLRGLSNALKDGTRQTVELRINDVVQKGWMRAQDRVQLAEPLRKGVYVVTFEITYADIDKPVRL